MFKVLAAAAVSVNVGVLVINLLNFNKTNAGISAGCVSFCLLMSWSLFQEKKK